MKNNKKKENILTAKDPEMYANKDQLGSAKNIGEQIIGWWIFQN